MAHTRKNKVTHLDWEPHVPGNDQHVDRLSTSGPRRPAMTRAELVMYLRRINGGGQIV